MNLLKLRCLRLRSGSGVTAKAEQVLKLSRCLSGVEGSIIESSIIESSIIESTPVEVSKEFHNNISFA